MVVRTYIAHFFLLAYVVARMVGYQSAEAMVTTCDLSGSVRSKFHNLNNRNII
jgi:hypothetical protein